MPVSAARSVLCSPPVSGNFGRFQPDVREGLNKTKAVADEILGKNAPEFKFQTSSSRESSIWPPFLTGLGLGFWGSSGGSRNTVINNNNYNINGNGNHVQGGKDNEKGSKSNLLLYIAFTIVGGACAFLVGNNWRTSRDAKEDLKEIEDLQDFYKLDENLEQNATNVNRVLKHHTAILERKKWSADFNLGITISVVAFAILAIIGLVFEVNLLLGAGLVALPLLGFIYLIKFGMDNSTKKNTETAKKIDGLISSML